MSAIELLCSRHSVISGWHEWLRRRWQREPPGAVHQSGLGNNVKAWLRRSALDERLAGVCWLDWQTTVQTASLHELLACRLYGQHLHTKRPTGHLPSCYFSLMLKLQPHQPGNCCLDIVTANWQHVYKQTDNMFTVGLVLSYLSPLRLKSRDCLPLSSVEPLQTMVRLVTWHCATPAMCLALTDRKWAVIHYMRGSQSELRSSADGVTECRTALFCTSLSSVSHSHHSLLFGNIFVLASAKVADILIF